MFTPHFVEDMPGMCDGTSNVLSKQMLLCLNVHRTNRGECLWPVAMRRATLTCEHIDYRRVTSQQNIAVRVTQF